MGEHGMSKNRFARLRGLAGLLWEQSLDEESSSKHHEYSADKDMWRWCSLRLLTTIIGITFANAMEWYGYFIASKTYDDDFIAFMRELSYDAMHNKIDEPCAAERSPTRAARRPAGDTSPIRMSPRQVACTHKLASIRVLGNYKGYRKQLCAVCHDNKHKTTFCCAFCSTPERVFALHPPTVSYRGETVTYSCLEDHLADPTNADHQKNRVCVSGRKRGRCRRPEDDEEVDGSDDEDE